MSMGQYELTRIFILPTRHGFAFLGLVIVMILVGSATANNLIYALAFVLFGVYMLAMVATQRNLKRLRIELLECEDSFVGESAKIRLAFLNQSARSRFLIQSQPRKFAARQGAVVNEIPSRSRVVVEVPVQIDRRGVYSVPSLQLGTLYPMGLFWAWSNLSLDGSIYIYPRRLGERELIPDWFGEGAGERQGRWAETQHEDFREHTKYQQGESHHHVDWKAFARHGELLTKRYETTSPQHFFLDWNQVSSLGVEAGLSQMSMWINELREGENSFELQLPSLKIGKGRGWLHGQECLRALARYKAEVS